MSSVKVVLYKSKTLSNGEHPIMLRVIINRKPKYLKVGYSCKATDWDDATNLPKRSHPLSKEVKIAIQQKELEAERLLLGLESENQHITSATLVEKLKKKKISATVFTYFDQTIERLTATGKIGYANVFRETKRNLKNFCGKKADIDFAEVDYTFLKKYEEWNIGRGLKLNSFFVFIRTFKTLLNNAIKEGVVPENYNPFKGYDFKKFRRIKTEKRALSDSELQQFINYMVEPTDAGFNSKNYFLFSLYCRGINFIDLAHLCWSNIKANRLEYVRKKTNERFSMKLLEPALKIIEYYKNLPARNISEYIFPILNDFHQTPQQKENRIDKILKKTNKELKQIGEKAGISGKITTYVARHSFATLLKRKGVPTAVISEMMGHDSEKTTAIYLAEFENTVLDEAATMLLL